MEIIRKILMPAASGVLRKSLLYTSLSGTLYAASSFIAVLLATRWTDDYSAGVLGLGFAISQQLYTFGNFSIGNFQASDAAEQYSFREYTTAKAMTVSAMFPVALVWILVGGYSPDKVAVLLFLILQRASESFCSVFTCRYQQKGRLDVGGKIEFAKNALSLAAFCGTLYLTRSVLFATALSACSHILLYFVLDSAVLDSFGGFSLQCPTRRVWELLLACMPLALNTFMLYLLNTVARLSLEKQLGTETLTVFNAIFMVSFAIPVAANFILAPFIASLGNYLKHRDYGKIWRFFFVQCAIIAVVGGAALSVAGLCGTCVLSSLFNKDLSPYVTELAYLIGGGIMLAFYQLAQAVITVTRRQYWSLAAIFPAVVYIFAATETMIAADGILGASKSFFFATAILSGCSFAILAMVAHTLQSGAQGASGQVPCPRD